MTRWQFVIAVARACLRREGLAFCALMASITGAGVLCGLLAWTIAILEDAKRSDAIANVAYGLLLSVIVILWSIGRLLAGKAAIEAELWQLKFKASQGGEDAPDAP